MKRFKLVSNYSPSGDQPSAIKKINSSLDSNNIHTTLMGITGSGKTFTAANVIEHIQKPTLVIAHNKTLAAQLANEYKEFFPNNAVHYFVSYYDYYQPEAYISTTDSYIEKEAQINQEIDRLRHATTKSLLTRRDVIVVASVSCIYGIGIPEQYKKSSIYLKKGNLLNREVFIKELIKIFFERTNSDLMAGKFRTIGNIIDIIPTNDIHMCRITLNETKIKRISKINTITQELIEENLEEITIFPAKHFVTSDEDRKEAIKSIKKELKEQLKYLNQNNKLLEAERLERRTQNDLALMSRIGYCGGIENYSRHFEKRQPGEPPSTLLSYFPKDKKGKPDFLTVIDESHVTIPQISGMYYGDRSRKDTLVKFGFRLPSALDNRPLKDEEFYERVDKILYTSATPADREKDLSKEIVTQIIRPTGLLDPSIDVRPITETKKNKSQVMDFINEIKTKVKDSGRALVTTLTKKSSEELSEYLTEAGINSVYLHSDIKTIERMEILTDFRKGRFDCLVGVNLLREGLDLPEVVLVAIFDADKQGFLRSTTSLMQTIGRAARNSQGRVILYADTITDSLLETIKETKRRRIIQREYNKKHNIKPKTIKKKISDITQELKKQHIKTVNNLLKVEKNKYYKNPESFIKNKKQLIEEAVKRLDFETAALIRDEIFELERK